MSFIDTDGRSARFRTRAQNWAITSESAPRSSKKCASTGTRSTCTIAGQHLGEGPLERSGTARVGAAAGSAAARLLIVGCW